MKDYNMDDYSALKGSTLIKGLASNEKMNFDSVEAASVFFARELDYVKAKAYEKKYPQLSALSFFPITSEIPEGAETATYYCYDIAKQNYAERKSTDDQRREMARKQMNVDSKRESKSVSARKAMIADMTGGKTV